MQADTRFVNPRKRPALADGPAAAATIAGFVACVICFALWTRVVEWLHGLPFWVELLLILGVGLAGSLIGLAGLLLARRLAQTSRIPDELGSLEMVGDHIVQFQATNRIAEIDPTLPYDYRILDRYDVQTAIFRLFQNDEVLTFRFSDPGAKEVVREVMGLSWPPPSRHAGRSYAPPAA